MEYLQINQNKLKITLTKAECESYGIKEEGGEFNSVSVRDSLGKILTSAGAKEEFRREGEKLLVQLFPVSDGGAELFVTRLSSVGERERRAVTSSPNLTTYKASRQKFIFDNKETLERAIKALRTEPSADLYRTYDGNYLLDILDERLGELSSSDILLEFSTRLPPNYLPSPEWDTLIYKDTAIKRLRENVNSY